MALLFAWDPKKAAANLRKHGVSFEEAATAFGDPYSLTVPDPDHSATEQRYLLLGYSEAGRLLVVAHLEDADQIRLITARVATRHERRAYEEEAP
ncbi:MAG: BrnT family toxin [Candidatus Acidiferrales bacterium]